MLRLRVKDPSEVWVFRAEYQVLLVRSEVLLLTEEVLNCFPRYVIVAVEPIYIDEVDRFLSEAESIGKGLG